MTARHDGAVGDARKRHTDPEEMASFFQPERSGDGCQAKVTVNGGEYQCERIDRHAGSHVTHPPNAVVGWGTNP